MEIRIQTWDLTAPEDIISIDPLYNDYLVVYRRGDQIKGGFVGREMLARAIYGKEAK